MTDQPAPQPTPGPYLREGKSVYALNLQGTNRFYCNLQGGGANPAPESELIAVAELFATSWATADECDRLKVALELALDALDNSLRSAGTSVAGYLATRKLMAKAQTQGRAVLDEARQSPVGQSPEGVGG